jgi:hypothetical protein
VGRLNLLLYSVYLVGFGMLFLALCSLAPGDDTAVVTFTLGCACVYFGFGLGYGPIPWVGESYLSYLSYLLNTMYSPYLILYPPLVYTY